MKYSLRKKHALAFFGLLLFVSALWMMKQEGELSKELATSSEQDLQPFNLMYPLGEGQHRREQQLLASQVPAQGADDTVPDDRMAMAVAGPHRRETIVLDAGEPSTEPPGPVEVKRGNFEPIRRLPLPQVPIVAAMPAIGENRYRQPPPASKKPPGRKKTPGPEKTKTKTKKRGGGRRGPAQQAPDVAELSDEEKAEFLRRMEDYCHFPSVPLEGQEGQVSGGYELHHVHVIARHGDRTPMTRLDLPNVTVDLAFDCDLERARDSFPPAAADGPEATGAAGLLAQFVASITAQEEALPSWPQMPWFLRQLPMGGGRSARRCGPAQLTPAGWLQHMQLGRRLRRAYAGKLVPHKAYYRNTNVTRFRSTINARTQQSAFAFMFGFLPRLELRHGEWLKPVDSASFCTVNCSCPALTGLRESKERRQSAAKRNDPQLQGLLRAVAAVLTRDGRPKDLPGVTGQQELYSALHCHGKPLPCGPDACLSPKHLARIIAFTDRASEVMRSHPRGPHQLFARLLMHPLLAEIAHQMKRIQHGAVNYPKFAFDSGHDITLSPLLDILGVDNFHWPGYAAYVAFELWSEAGGHFYLRLLYNGRDRTKAVRFCRDSLTPDGLCPLRSLLKFVGKDNMAFFRAQSYEEACKLNFSVPT